MKRAGSGGAMSKPVDSFGAHSRLRTSAGEVAVYRLDALARRGIGHVDRLPFSIRVLLENALRNLDNFQVDEQAVVDLAGWDAAAYKPVEIPFKPARVILQDFTGVPSVVDLAALRSAMQRMGGDPAKINPVVPVDLVIDHSVQVDHFARPDALPRNAEMEFLRNRERYEFLHWGQKAFDNFRVVPPATGIVHQVNLEFLANVVQLYPGADGEHVALPDTLVGTDSHTTMINGLGVVGWGVGGIEAEAAMLGQPVYMLMPEVVGFRLTGSLPEGATATDLVLVVTQMLRERGVVSKFVEFHGSGLDSMTLPDRATIANMAPEYGATIGFFPVDDETLSYLRRTGRDEAQIDLVERYCKMQGLFRSADTPDLAYNDTLELDLGSVQPSLAGPLRPQDRILLRDMQPAFQRALRAPVGPRGYELSGRASLASSAGFQHNGHSEDLKHGAVVIAAITSCTNTSNPSVMVAAGLLARNAVEKGLRRKPWVKTSLAPGSRVVTAYLDQAGLTPCLEALGFHTVGYGCTTCIRQQRPAARGGRRRPARGGPGGRGGAERQSQFRRAHQSRRARQLPRLAAAGRGLRPGRHSRHRHATRSARPGAGRRRRLPARHLAHAAADSGHHPEQSDARALPATIQRRLRRQRRRGTKSPARDEAVYRWDADSTYIQEPPFFMDLAPRPGALQPIEGARALVMAGDSMTTDHISPAGAIAVNGPAGLWLQERDVSPPYFNSFGSRRGNHEVMMRGTFANVRLRNLLLPGTEGGITRHFPSGETLPVYDAAMRYIADGTPLIVLAGRDYGMGSSRDWAAKGTQLLGARAVIAASIERIHRSNLVMMGVLPLTFLPGESVKSLGLSGEEHFDIPVPEDIRPGQRLTVTASDDQGHSRQFEVEVRLDTPVEVEYYRNGGILQTVLRNFLDD